MPVWHEDVIDIVHAKLDELMAAPMPYVIDGRKERAHHDCYPLIVWKPAQNGGKIGPNSGAGGNPTPIGIDTIPYLVTIWQDSKANCRAMLHNLIVAARASRAKSAVRIGMKYEFPQDAHADAGALLVATSEVDVVVTNEITPLVDGSELEFRGGLILERGDGTVEVVATDVIRPA